MIQPGKQGTTMRDFATILFLSVIALLGVAYLVFATPSIVDDHLSLHADRLVHEANL